MEGADKDIAAIWSETDNAWSTNENYFRLPSYLKDMRLPTLSSYERILMVVMASRTASGSATS
jgi:hypothetical protein